MKRYLSLISLRQFAGLSIFVLAMTVAAQPLTSVMASLVRVPPTPLSSKSNPAKAGDPAVKTPTKTPASSDQQRPESIQTAFTNSTPILIPATQNAIAGIGSPYPSNITVSGMTGAISSVTVTLNQFQHGQQKDVDLLLVGPGGQTFKFMSDIGGANGSSPGTNIFDLTFDDAAATQAPLTTISATATYKPTDGSTTPTDAFPGPAPAGPYNEPAPTGAATFTSVYGGLSGASVNGTWSLYSNDDTGGEFGKCNGGWTINITTTVAAAATTTTIQSSLNPSLTTDMASFTAHVTETTGGANVTLGTVTFVDNSTATVLASNVPLNGSGNASTPNVSLVERRHLITATYNPDPTHLSSNASLFQQVDFPTTNPTPGEYCNTNSITVPESGTSGTAFQYPSRITVSGLTGRITKLTVDLNNVTHTAAQDMDFLLVGPGGQNLVLVADAGGATSNVSLVIDDAAAGQLAAGGAWGTTGTTVNTRPVSYTAGDTFPSPAPAGPYNEPAPAAAATLASVFNNTLPNGVWSLYIVDDAGGDSGTIAGGWCLNFTTSGGAPLDFDGDGTTDYAVVRDSGLPRPAPGETLSVGGPRVNAATDEVTVLNAATDPSIAFNPLPINGQWGRFFRMPGERFDPLAMSMERGDSIAANQMRWLIRTSGPTADLNILFGTLADFPVPADYDGDGKCDLGVWTGGAGAQFRVLTSSSGYVTTVTYTLGSAISDPSVVGDYDGDGRADPAVVNRSTGVWSYLGGATHATLTTVTPVGTFGGGFPIPGDYDGDGKYDFMLETRDGVNPTMGHYYQWNNTGSLTPPATANFAFGNYRDVVIPGDYNGDFSTDIAVASLIVNPIAWRVRLTGPGTILGPFNLGNPAVDYTLGGDYNGGGTGDLTIWHSPGQFQSLLGPTFVGPTTDFSWGQAGDYPVAYFNSH